MTPVSTKNLSVPQLLTLRDDIDKQLLARKAELQAQLAQIGGDVSSGRRQSVKGSKVAAKYRHPRTGETWSGRGGVAGWLAREIKSGKKREDFLIAKPVKKKRAGKAR